MHLLSCTSIWLNQLNQDTIGHREPGCKGGPITYQVESIHTRASLKATKAIWTNGNHFQDFSITWPMWPGWDKYFASWQCPSLSIILYEIARIAEF